MKNAASSLKEAREADKFFGTLVKLIPSDLYLHSQSLSGYVQEKPKQKDAEAEEDEDDEEEEEDESSNYIKGKRRPLTKEEKKIKSKSVIEKKYAADSTLDKDLISKTSEEEVKDEQQTSAEPPSKEELHRRLQEKISQMQSSRQSKKDKDAKKETKKDKKDAKKDKKETKQAPVSEEEDSTTEFNDEDFEDELEAFLSGPSFSAIRSDEDSASEIEEAFDFSKMITGEEKRDRHQESKKAGGKKKLLEKKLQEIQLKKERLNALVNSEDKLMQKKAQEEQWNDAFNIASGGKALLVSLGSKRPTAGELKIKKKLKAKEKQKEKSFLAWTNRLNKVEEDKKAAIDKRETNIKNKKNRTEKQMELITAEKKLYDSTRKGATMKDAIKSAASTGRRRRGDGPGASSGDGKRKAPQSSSSEHQNKKKKN